MTYVAVAGAVVSVGMGIFGASASKKEAQKQRDQQLLIAKADIANREKIAMEELRTLNETQRIGFLASNLEKYREALQKESTIRLRDTWIYVAGLGAGTGVLYGLFLMASKSGSNGK